MFQEAGPIVGAAAVADAIDDYEIDPLPLTS